MADAMDVDNTKTSTPKDFPDGQQSDAVKQKHVLLVTADGTGCPLASFCLTPLRVQVA